MQHSNNPFDTSEIFDTWRRLKGPIIAIAIVALLALGALTSFFTVQPEEEAVVKRFGKVVAVRPPGLHFKLPYGIDKVVAVPTARILKEEFGFRTAHSESGRTGYRKDPSLRNESLMLTGDLKVIDVEWVVQFLISDPDKFLHRARDPVKTLRDTSEAVMRRIVGNSLGSDVLTEKRVEVSTACKEEMQTILDHFDLGIHISTVELQDVTPPDSVKPAFNEVNQAEQERERFVNEAEKRRNQVIPRAEGQAKQVIAEAEAYALERVNRARGEAARFEAILAEYQNAPEVTRRRMYLEMVDQVIPLASQVYIMESAQHAPLPLLNLGDPLIQGVNTNTQEPAR